MYAVAKGECDRIVVAWVLLFPLGYYFLSFPRERPVIQFDRTIVLVLFGAMLFARRCRTRPIPQDIKSAAVAWALFLTAALVSLCRGRTCLPRGTCWSRLSLSRDPRWYLRQFRFAAHAIVLHAAISIRISLYSAGIGIAEVLPATRPDGLRGLDRLSGVQRQ